jgi:DNA modification methylase
LGSGTTAVVAEQLKRNWIGIEINKKYVEFAKKRIKDYKNK